MSANPPVCLPVRGFRCPFCGSRRRPYIQESVSSAGWMWLLVTLILTSLFAILTLFFCWPLLIGLPVFLIIGLLGLRSKDEYKVCSDCGIKLG